MISVTELYQFVSQTRRSGSSGFEPEEDFNMNMSIVDNEIYRTLVPFYAKDDRIQKLFAPFIETTPELPVVDGVISLAKDTTKPDNEFPNNYSKYIDTIFGDGTKIVYPRNLNERATIKGSPIDAPTIDSEEYFCFFDGESISYLPEAVESAKIVYIRKAIPGLIEYQVTETEDSDYITPVSVRDIEWPAEMFGLFSALMLEKYGFQNRESIAVEYSNLGLQRELANTTR